MPHIHLRHPSSRRKKTGPSGVGTVCAKSQMFYQLRIGSPSEVVETGYEVAEKVKTVVESPSEVVEKPSEVVEKELQVVGSFSISLVFSSAAEIPLLDSRFLSQLVLVGSRL